MDVFVYRVKVQRTMRRKSPRPRSDGDVVQFSVVESEQIKKKYAFAWLMYRIFYCDDTYSPYSLQSPTRIGFATLQASKFGAGTGQNLRVTVG